MLSDSSGLYISKFPGLEFPCRALDDHPQGRWRCRHSHLQAQKVVKRYLARSRACGHALADPRRWGKGGRLQDRDKVTEGQFSLCRYILEQNS